VYVGASSPDENIIGPCPTGYVDYIKILIKAAAAATPVWKDVSTT
jgi:hypothetical protein